MNGNWGEIKRHHVLFRALRKMDKKIRVALVGMPWGGRTKLDVIHLAEFYNVDDQLTIFEKVSYEQVMRINCESKVSILLSLKEGANRAIPEAFFCDVPAIVLRNNIGGQIRNICIETGMLSIDGFLHKDLETVLSGLDSFSPRSWAMKNISSAVSTQKLNNQIRARAVQAGGDWTLDIVERTNSPDLHYYSLVVGEDYTKHNKALERGYLVSRDFLCNE